MMSPQKQRAGTRKRAILAQEEIEMSIHRVLTVVAATALTIIAGAAPVWSLYAGGVGHSELTAITGRGSGQVVVSPVPGGAGSFDVEITVNIHGAEPNTTFSIVRAPDFTPNGVCTGSFVPFGESLTTSEGGSGATHFQFHRDGFAAGVEFDVVFRALGSDGSIPESNCMEVRIK
jgi:hypothetical protein